MKTYLKPVLDVAATGKNIKTLMRQNGISVRALQTILDSPYPQVVYNWLNGKNMPMLDNLVVLSQVFGVPMDEIVATRQVEVAIDSDDGESLKSA